MNEVSQFVFGLLLAEFKKRGLTAQDLQNGYEGLPPDEIRERAVATGINEVDYDLTFSDLVKHDLVKTGPMVPFENDPNSGFIVVALYSKNQYSYLTEDGYKEAVAMSKRDKSVSKANATNIRISRSTFHNSPIGTGENITQVVASSEESFDQAVTAFRDEVSKIVGDQDKQREILLRLDELEAATSETTRFDAYNNLVATIGNHITVLSFLLPPLLHTLRL
jgi:hypothetical protein